MCKVVFVISSMVANGAERVMSLLVNKAVELGIDTTLVLVSSAKIEYELSEKVRVRFLAEDLPKGRTGAAYGRYSGLRKVIRETKPDLVVSFLTTCNIYACLASIGFGVPVIVSERNDPVRDCPSKIRRFVRNTAYRLADGFIFQTEDAKNHFTKAIRNKGIVIPNPVKDGLPFAELQNREKTVVAAGRLTGQKNYPMMLEAFAKFAKTHPDYKLQIYGSGEDEMSLREMAKDLGVVDSVIFMGVAKDLHQRIKNAGMFVLSSDYEGISNSLLEAMSMGLPCVSTDCPCGGSRHLIEDGISGLLTSVGDADAFAQAMNRIADDAKLAKTLGENAKHTRITHSEAEIIKKYFDFMERVCK